MLALNFEGSIDDPGALLLARRQGFNGTTDRLDPRHPGRTAAAEEFLDQLRQHSGFVLGSTTNTTHNKGVNGLSAGQYVLHYKPPVGDDKSGRRHRPERRTLRTQRLHRDHRVAHHRRPRPPHHPTARDRTKAARPDTSVIASVRPSLSHRLHQEPPGLLKA